MMKKIITVTALAALLLAGCAKAPSSGQNDAAKRYFNAWAEVNWPKAQRSGLGSVIIERTDGNGRLIGDSNYITVDYTLRSLDGAVSATTLKEMAMQTGAYSPVNFYGPAVWYRFNGALYAGADELLDGMHVGAHVKAAIPGWLLTTNRYDDASGYEDNETGTDMIYDFTVRDAFDDIEKYEVDSLVRYMRRNYPKVDVADTVGNGRNRFGFYYICLKESDAPDSVFTTGTKVYLNYTGRLLNGQVFDTTDKNTAKDAGIYNPSGAYSPTYVKWPDTSDDSKGYGDITMGSNDSSVIDGFAYAVYHMKPHEKGIAIFYSAYGYSYSGSGSTIPAYSPLIFELELTDETK